jgi:hypothetical protein
MTPCSKCGAPLPPVPLGAAVVHCTYCKTAQAAPAAPGHAWVAENHRRVAPIYAYQRVTALITKWSVIAYVVFLGGILVVGLLSLAVSAVW